MSNENIDTAIAVLFESEMTDKGLEELRERFPVNVIHDMTDPVQFKEARKVRTEMNKLLEAIKARRIGVTSGIKVRGDDLSSAVELAFAPVVAPFIKQLEVNKLAKEKEERELKELLDGQRKEINAMNDLVNQCINASSTAIAQCIEAAENIDPSIFHKDIIHEAIEAKENVNSRLGELLAKALGEESLAEERKKLRAQQEQAEAERRILELKSKAQGRLNNLSMIPTHFFGEPAAKIKSKIESLENYEVLISEFGELFDTACAAKQKVIDQLTTMHSQQVTVEESQAKAAEAEAQKQAEAVTEESEQVKQTSIMPEPTAKQEALFSSAHNAAVKDPVFKSMEMNTSLNESFERETMAMFFGEENISNASTDCDGNEYNLEVIVRRTSIK